MTEAQIQATIVEYIETVVPRCVVMAIPNAARRGYGQRAGNAVAGLTKGAPDLSLTVCGRALFFEVKTANGIVADDQRHVHDRLRIAGAQVAIVRSVEDVRTALSAWGVETRESKPLFGAAA